MRKYILADDGVTPVLEPDLVKWAEWFEGSCRNRAVAGFKTCGYRVSTVFLGIDHSFAVGAEGPPVLWETIVFFPEVKHATISDPMWRYHTRDEAVAAHEKICVRLYDLLLQKAEPLEVAEELNKLEI